MNELTTRAYSVELRADEENKGIIEGMPIVFNSGTIIKDWLGDFEEIIDRHALDNADLKDVCLLVNHDFHKIPLARSKNGKGTMSFSIEDDGVHIRAELDIVNNSEARSLYSAVSRGDITGMSFAFRISKEEWTNVDSDRPTRIIKEISIVHEVSCVNYPAYPQTSVNARSGEETPYSPLKEIKEKREIELEKARNNNIKWSI